MEVLPPTLNALELHVQGANYQVKMRLQADIITIVVTLPPEARKESACLKSQWTRLPPVPLVNLELVTCSCVKKGARLPGAPASKNNLECTFACVCDSMDRCDLD